MIGRREGEVIRRREGDVIGGRDVKEKAERV